MNINDIQRYMDLAIKNKNNSPCLSRKIGCVLLLESSIWIGGHNTQPDGISKCQECPRKKLGMKSGQGLDLCSAVHAERSVLLTAAKYGLKTDGSILFTSTSIPCKDCLLELIHAGVKQIICGNNSFYDVLSERILNEWISGPGKLCYFDDNNQLEVYFKKFETDDDYKAFV